MRPEAGLRAPGGPRLGSLATGNLVLLALAAAALAAAWHLRLSPRDLAPGAGGLAVAREFFGRALTPAFAFEGPYAGSTSEFFVQIVRAVLQTVKLAAAALSLAVAGGLAGGLLGAASWRSGRGWSVVTFAVRALLNLMRSVHELIWAVLLLAALGRSEFVAVVAIAIPYAGVLGKIFAEMIDEAPRDAAGALELAGATPGQRFVFALLPRALPHMLAYTFYRFECALRSSAVLGFFGFPTLGYHIAASFENLHYGEVWTYLYVLFALVLAVDWWSGRLRREALA
jgi:phosphonate transport system permease protein